jgi:LPXTG-site transpeptidase (sortase) family protein
VNIPYSRIRLLLIFAGALPLIVLVSLLLTSTASGAPVLSVSPITWNVIGLDSNDVTAGPNNFPVGVRVCNSGPDPATNVAAIFSWDDGGNPYNGDPYINLRSGSLSSISAGSIGAGTVSSPTCEDFYFEVSVTRNASAYDHVRRYRITVTADGGITLTTPVPRELYVEYLISQSRNSTTNVLLDGAAIPAGATMALVVGNTYDIRLEAATATNGYEQIESFINFPNTIFRINSVATTYTAHDPVSPDPDAGTKLYADGCGWEDDPNSPNYRSCLDTGKYGGTVIIDYNVTIIGGGGTDQTLNSLIYDFSGSSYHYNSDFSTGARVAAIIDPLTVDIEKSFSPSTTQVDGISTLTFTITNPNGALLSGLNFTDTFPTSPGAMLTSGTAYTATGCGTPTVRAPIGGGSYASGQPSVSVSDVTVAANGSCTISIQVTAPATGTYSNTSSHLFIDAVDTGNHASASLVMNDAPAPPACTPGIVMARWTFDGTAFTPSYVDPDVSSTSQTYNGTGTSAISSTFGNPVNSWGVTSGWAGDDTGYPNGGAAPYFEFQVDSSNFTGVDIRYDFKVEGNWAAPANNWRYTYSNANGGGFTTINSTSGFRRQDPWVAVGPYSASVTGTSSTSFRINAVGQQNATAGVYLDNVVVTGCGIPDPPALTKSFSPDPVAVGGTSTLTFAITNPNPYADLNGIAFSDTLPGGVTVATSSPVTTCGGSLSTTAPDTINFAGGSLAAGTSCTLSGITVTAASTGSHLNLSGNISATNSGTNFGQGGTASDTLTALAPPQIEKLFTPNPVVVSGISTLTFTITNPNQDYSLSGVAFTDLLPAGVTVSGSVITPQCGGAVAVTDVGGRDQISLSGGTIGAGTSCGVMVDTTAAATGSYANTSGSVTALVNGSPVGSDTAADTLLVTDVHPSLSMLKQVSATGSDPWRSFVAVAAGAPVYYRFTVENTGDVALSGVYVSDPALSPGSPPPALAGCTWASIPAYETRTCTFGPITAASGDHVNTATAQGTYNSAAYSDSASARYATPELSIVKSAAEAYFTEAGETLHYSFVVTNTGYAPLAGPVAVTDDLAADEDCPAVSTATQTSPSGPGDGDDWLDPGETVSCTATYTTAAGDVTAGLVTNTASASADGVTSTTDSETVPLAALTIDKDTGTPTAAAGGTATYTIRIANTGGVPLTGIVISDALPAGFTFASTGSITLSGAGTSRTSTSNPAVGDSTPSWGTWTIDGGGSVALTFTADIGGGVSAGTYDNTASVVSTEVPGPTDDDGTAAQDAGTPPGQDPEDDEDVTVVSTGAITIVKDAVPDDAQDFAYAGTGPSGYDFGGGFSLDDDADGTLPSSLSFTNLTPGSYSLSEAAAAGWILTGLVCLDPDSGSSVDLGTRTATIDLDAAETVTCTFTNTQLGTITVVKDAVPDDAQDFAYTGNGPSGYDFGGGFSLDDDADGALPNSQSFTDLAPGSYTLTEGAASGWSLTGLACVDPDGGSSENTATLTAAIDLDAGETVTCTFTNSQSAPALSIVKEVGASAAGPWDDTSITLNPGDDVYYRITVGNPGNVALTGITVDDPDVDTSGCAWTDPLAVGSTTSCVVGPFTALPGTHNNTATADSSETGPEADGASYFGSAPELTVEKTSGTASLLTPGTVTYDYLVTNTGNVGLTGISLADDNDNDDMSCGTTNLAPGGTTTCTATHTFTQAELDAGGTLDNQVTASSNEAADATDALSIPIVQTPSLTVAKEVSDDNSTWVESVTVSVGATVYYRVRVANTGNLTLTGLNVTDPACTLVQGLDLTGDNDGDFEVGEEWAYYCSVTALAGTNPNTATADSSETEPETDGASYVGAFASLSVTKNGSLDAGPDGQVTPGDIISYTILVTNTSSVTITNVAVSDPLIILTCPSGNPIPSLASGVSEICIGSNAITQADIDSGAVSNTATASGQDPAGNPVSDSDSFSQPLDQSPELTLTKSITAGSPYAALGDVITYSYRVENTGGVTLSGPFTIEDDQSTDENCPGTASLAPGAFLTCTASHSVLAADLTAGSITNSAYATGFFGAAPVTSNTDQATAVGVSDPALTKSGNPASAQVGDAVTFTLQVTNNGLSPATGVVVTDAVPSFLDIDSVTVVPAADPPVIDLPTNTVTVTIPTVNPGSLYTITISTTVNALGAPPGGTNSAALTSASADADPNNNAGSASIGIFAVAGLASPATGFAPDRVTRIPMQDSRSAYESYGALALTIPALGLEAPIVGVPLAADGWDVTWLWNQVGYLAGTAFPGWDGNSVLTGHVYLPSGLPGPFVGLSRLRWGDRVIVESFGTAYTYEVRETRLYRPGDDRIIRHEETPWLTLITCQGYDERMDTYRWRRVVRAVLIDVDNSPLP